MAPATLVWLALQLVPTLDRGTAREIGDAVHDAAKYHDVDDVLLLALAFRESTLDPTKVNPSTGCAGLMQIAPVHHKGVGRTRVLSVRWSAFTGARILRAALDRCGGDPERAVSRYNGRGCRRSTWAREVLQLTERLRAMAARS